ncbi:unnamed protein product [Onchocerca flexuosa]|uniref:Uncharacterized protein n=1 Tax=Onchocerca flexuosa TaxID=387005 RepID=A0A183HW84_9BILA|nr:unnamed protein product [Onchocerca flexuosa]
MQRIKSFGQKMVKKLQTMHILKYHQMVLYVFFTHVWKMLAYTLA